MSEILIEKISFRYLEDEDYVFRELSMELPPGVTTFVGQNGTGKSTLLLLGGGVLLPEKGDVYVKKVNTKELRDEQLRQKYVSFIYQNMEFETEETIGQLLEFVYSNGFHEEKKDDFIDELVKILELKAILTKKTQEISKGELQRTIIGFSLLYGSQIIMMDEPIFALEEKQKYSVMEYLYHYAEKNNTSLFYSAHEMDISLRFSKQALLFYKNGEIHQGKTDEILTKENLEKAYETPLELLKDQERISNKILSGK